MISTKSYCLYKMIAFLYVMKGSQAAYFRHSYDIAFFGGWTGTYDTAASEERD